MEGWIEKILKKGAGYTCYIYWLVKRVLRASVSLEQLKRLRQIQFLLRWLQDLPAEVFRSGQLAISFIMLC